MMKFFRQIRRNSLSEGETVKYLKYAIGEIILVVIGILIALQINNWNTNIKRLDEETVLLESLKEDFLENKKRLNETIHYQKGMIHYSNSFINLILNNTKNTVSIDSIIKLKAYGANSWYRAELVNSTFKTIVSSGKIDLLQNQNLIKKLIEFSTDLESGFEDDFESKECLGYLNKLSYAYESDFMSQEDRKDLGIKATTDSIRKSINKLLSKKPYLGALINKTGIESGRLDYQKKLLDRTNDILREFN